MKKEKKNHTTNLLIIIQKSYLRNGRQQKKLGELIELGKVEVVLIDMETKNPTCPLKCELPLRWRLPCRPCMYPAFIYQVPIPASLIHPCWFLDGPSQLETPWKIGFSPTHDAQKAQSTIPEPEDRFERLGNIEELKNARYSGDQYRNNGRNMMMRAVVNAVNQQKELEGPAAEEFARTFEKHTVRLAAAAKLQADNQKSLLPQLPTPLSEPNL